MRRPANPVLENDDGRFHAPYVNDQGVEVSITEETSWHNMLLDELKALFDAVEIEFKDEQNDQLKQVFEKFTAKVESNISSYIAGIMTATASELQIKRKKLSVPEVETNKLKVSELDYKSSFYKLEEGKVKSSIDLSTLIQGKKGKGLYVEVSFCHSSLLYFNTSAPADRGTYICKDQIAFSLTGVSGRPDMDEETEILFYESCTQMIHAYIEDSGVRKHQLRPLGKYSIFIPPEFIGHYTGVEIEMPYSDATLGGFIYAVRGFFT
jgi:hypothetical protein